ncbi:MAG: hypothetical protein ACIALR_17410, partial [Blastopirellula sp. JB062]
MSTASSEAGTWAQQRHDIAEIEASLGFAGRFKIGVWSPIRVSITAGEEPLQGKIHIGSFDSDGVPVEHRWPHGKTAEIAAGQTESFVLPVKIGRTSSRLEIIFESEDGTTSRRSVWQAGVQELGQPVLASQQLWLLSGELPGVDDLMRQQRAQPHETSQLAQITPHDLPHDWRMLEGVDRLLIVGGDAPMWQALESDKLDAMDWWTKLGGRIFLAVSADAEALLTDGAPLARFLPGKYAGTEEERQTGELEKYAGKVSRLDRPGTPLLKIAMLTDARGIALVERASGDTTPLISLASYGFGLVEFVAFDLNSPPIVGWDGRQPLLTKLLSGESEQQDVGIVSLAGQSAAHVGYEDISGQLRVALDQFQGVYLISFFLIGLIIVVY